MNLDQAMAELKAMGSDKMRKINAKNGVGENQFGVQMGDIRKLAKQIKSDHDLGLALWATQNWDAMLLATLLIKPKQLSADEVDRMLGSMPYSRDAMMSWLSEWVMTNIVKPHPAKEELRHKWMHSDENRRAKAGWNLTAERVVKNPDGLDLGALLDRIEDEMGDGDPYLQWGMNYALAQIGIEFPEHRNRALSIGETLGVFRDYPVSKGCTSPFAPIWINAMAGRAACKT